ncbi:MAG: GDSL-type esterase/lipase family protein [Tumebacillaceae bacterium]
MADTAKTPLLIALGDSITAGVGGKWNRGYPKHLHELLEAHLPDLKLINWGIPGLTIPKLTKALKKGEHLHGSLAEATCIVMTIGGNDILKAMPKNVDEQTHAFTEADRERVAKNLNDMMTTLRELTQSPVYIGDLYNPFPQSPLAATLIGAFNAQLVHPLAQQFDHVYIVRTSEALLGQEDRSIQYYKSGTLRDLKKFWRHPIHPNDEGHAALAQAFYQVIRETMQKPQKTEKPQPRKNRPSKQKSNTGDTPKQPQKRKSAPKRKAPPSHPFLPRGRTRPK